MSVISPAAAIVRSPKFVIETLFAVNTGALKVKLVPVSAMFEVKLRSPLNVVVPSPALWVREVAVIPLTVTFVALGMVIAPRGTELPTARERVILPVPGIRVSAWL